MHQAEFETKRLRKLSFREWHQPGFQDHRRCLGRREEADQRTSRLGLPDRSGERTRVKNHRLELGRNRADEGNSRDIYQLADLLEADLRLATTLATGSPDGGPLTFRLLLTTWSATPSLANNVVDR